MSCDPRVCRSLSSIKLAPWTGFVHRCNQDVRHRKPEVTLAPVAYRQQVVLFEPELVPPIRQLTKISKEPSLFLGGRGRRWI